MIFTKTIPKKHSITLVVSCRKHPLVLFLNTLQLYITQKNNNIVTEHIRYQINSL